MKKIYTALLIGPWEKYGASSTYSLAQW